MNIYRSTTEDYPSAIGATTRTIITFSVYFLLLIIFGIVISKVSTPDVLVNLPDQVPQVCAITVVLLTLVKLFDSKISNYGIKISRRSTLDLLAGVIIGVLFKIVSSTALLVVGDLVIVDSWSMGVFESVAGVSVAVISTFIAYFIVAVGEDFMFRGILIREFVVGLTSVKFSRKSATILGVIISSLIFGSLHLSAGAEGLSTSVVVLQAVIGGIYFGISYVLTDSLSVPIGIHFSTNIWTILVFGHISSGYPAVFVIDRSIELGLNLFVTLVFPSIILVGAVVLWYRITRDKMPEISLKKVSGN